MLQKTPDLTGKKKGKPFPRLSKITTRNGDSGETGLADGTRCPKDDLIIEVLGDVDELHASLGLLKASMETPLDIQEINWIEHCLLRIGGMLAVPLSHPAYEKLNLIGVEDIESLEARQKKIMAGVDLPPVFITYGSSESGARADVARAVCRRTERHMVKLIREKEMRNLKDTLMFLNRLSDLLFIKARELDNGAKDVLA